MPRVHTIAGSTYKRAKGTRMTLRVAGRTLHRSIVGWVDRARNEAYQREGGYGAARGRWCVRGLRGQASKRQGRCYKTLAAAVRAGRG